MKCAYEGFDYRKIPQQYLDSNILIISRDKAHLFMRSGPLIFNWSPL